MKMQAAGLTPNVHTYNSLISAYDKGGQWQRAMLIFKEITQAEMTLDIHTYNPLLSVLWVCGHRAKAIELFEKASEAGVYPQGDHKLGMIDLHELSNGAALASLTLWLDAMAASTRLDAAGLPLTRGAHLEERSYTCAVRHPRPRKPHRSRERYGILEVRGTGGQLQAIASTPQTEEGTHMGLVSSACAVRLRRAWWQPRAPQPLRAATGSVGAYKPWTSPAADDHRIRVGGAEAPRERPLPAPRTSVGSPRATNPPLFFAGEGCAFFRAGLASVRTRPS